ncbi:MAG: CNNM domain-containing protein [Planctomycetaceae bacterium]|nr:CNNM domain-containing protein [Planctomycetaceae bacterium]
MRDFLPYTPAFGAMLILMVLSAFFSCSEAAFFSLSQTERSVLKSGGSVSRLSFRLLENSERLLNSILLGNLVVNLLTFTISSIVVFKLQHQGRTDLAGFTAIGSLLSVILFCEVLPKNVGVLSPRFFVLLWAVPLSLVVRFLQPVLPILQMTNILSRRLFCPHFSVEPYLRIGDLERAVEMSGEDATLLKREQRVLQNIVSISDIRTEELMRPRSLLKTFHPPISFEQILESLQGKLPRSGYCLLTETDSDEIALALSFTQFPMLATDSSWENQFEPIIYVPWSSSVAEVFDRLQRENRSIAVVINEFGETVGILTLDDIIETIFTREQGRSRRLLNQIELRRITSECWQLNGLTSLRRLRRKFGVSFSGYSSLTVGGLIREMLERFPKTGDICRVDSLEFHVMEVSEDDDLIVHMITKNKQ